MNSSDRSSFMVIKRTPKVEIRDGRPHMSNVEETTTVSESCYVMDSSEKWFIEIIQESGLVKVRAHGAESLVITPLPESGAMTSPKRKKKDLKKRADPVPDSLVPPTLKRHDRPLQDGATMTGDMDISSPASSKVGSAFKDKGTGSDGAFHHSAPPLELLELVKKDDSANDRKGGAKSYAITPTAADLLKDVTSLEDSAPTPPNAKVSSKEDDPQTMKGANSLPFDLHAFAKTLRNSECFSVGLEIRGGCLTFQCPDKKLLYIHFTQNKEGNNQINFNLGNTRRRNSADFSGSGWEPFFSKSVSEGPTKDIASKIYSEFMVFIADSC